jgi:hypothetical protein
MRQRHENITPLSPHNMLYVTIHWLRKYPSFDDMVALFQQTKRYLVDMVKHVVQLIDAVIVSEFIRPIDHSHLTYLYSVQPPTCQHVKIIVDSTFIPLPKMPFKPTHYHKKCPTKTAWKFEIDCDLSSHRVVCVSKAYRAAQHDMHIIRQSGILQQASTSLLIIGDKGYAGQLGIISHKRRRGRGAGAAGVGGRQGEEA